MCRRVKTNPVNIKKIKIGKIVKNFYLCTQKVIKNTKVGEPYIDITLKNSFGIVNAKLWNNVEHFKHKFTAGKAVAVKAECSEYKGVKCLTILSINNVVNHEYNRYGYIVDHLFEKPKTKSHNIYKKIKKNIDAIKSEYRLIIDAIYTDNSTQISQIPLTLDDEYSHIGGYLFHITNMLKISDTCKEYSGINNEILNISILIHDIGKIHYFDCNNIPLITDDGKLFGATSLGIKLVKEYGKKVNVESNIISDLCHIIISFEKIYLMVKEIDMELKFNEINILKQVKILDLESYKSNKNI